MPKKNHSAFKVFHETPLGRIIHGDSREVLATCDSESVDLIMTSPPFGLVRKKGYRAKKRPSGHDISSKFSIDNGAAIPPNLIAIPNTESNSFYLRYCEEKGFKPHPARYPAELPEYFIRMLSERGDLVIDPFAGSCVTGEVCERTKRRWKCIELLHDYCQAALGRFVRDPRETAKPVTTPDDPSNYYRVPRPGILWDSDAGPLLPVGRARSW